MELAGDLKARPELSALDSFIKDDSSLPSAVEAFSRPTAEAVASEGASKLEDSLWYAYNVIVATGAGTPHAQQQPLVDFVQELRKKQLKNPSGDDVKHQHGQVWKDLPTFGWVVRDAWNAAPDYRSSEEKRARWVNQNAFVARLTALPDGSTSDPLDLSLFGLWSLRTGLEDPKGRPADKTALQAASVWFLYAAKQLWALTQAEKSFDGNVARGGGEYANEGWKGFNEARWRAWKDALTDQIKEFKDAETQDIAKKAIERIMEADGTIT